MPTVYTLTDAGRAMAWSEWRAIGGCGLSHYATAVVAQSHGPEAHWPHELTLGQIADAYAGAGRELAHYAHEVLGRRDLAHVDERGR